MTTRRVLLAAGVTLALGFCLCSGLVAGLLGGERGAYHRRFQEERDAIVPLLAGDPAFAGVELHDYSAGGMYLLGEVPTAEDLGRLRAVVVRAVGERRARELLLTGRVFGGEEAHRAGLVTEVVEAELLEERVLELAAGLVANSPEALAATKRLLVAQNKAWLDGAIAASLEANAAARETADFREGVTAFLEKRRPVWAK